VRLTGIITAVLLAALLAAPAFAGNAIEVRRPGKPAPKSEKKHDGKLSQSAARPAASSKHEETARVRHVELSMRAAERGPLGNPVGRFHSPLRAVSVMGEALRGSATPDLRRRARELNLHNQVALGAPESSQAKTVAASSVAQITAPEGPEQAARPEGAAPQGPSSPPQQAQPGPPLQASPLGTPTPPTGAHAPGPGNPVERPPLPREHVRPPEHRPAPRTAVPSMPSRPEAPSITTPKGGAGEATPAPPAQAERPEAKASTEVKMSLPKGFARIVVPNGRITGDTGEKKYHVEGGVEIYWEDIVIKADTADIDDAAETASLSGNVDATDPTYNMKASNMKVRFKDKLMDASEFVQFSKLKAETEKPAADASKRARITTILKNNKTKVYCNALTYNWDKGDFEATGEVKIVQDDLSADCDKLSYVKDGKQYTMEGSVFVTLSKYEWLFTNNIIEKPDEKVGRTLAKQDSTLSANTVVFGEDSEVATADGTPEKKAVIEQKDKRVEAPHIVIDDRTKDFTASGGVTMHQDSGDWLLESEQIKREQGDEDFIKEVKNPLDVTGDKMDYYYEKKNLDVDGNVKVQGKEKAAASDTLTYDDETKLLVFDKNVVITRGKKEHMFCDHVEINTDKRTFTFKGGVDGFFRYSTEQETTTTGGTGAGAGGQSQPPSGGAQQPSAGSQAGK
jgi:lipopolysaccharide export system protein LptA